MAALIVLSLSLGACGSIANTKSTTVKFAPPANGATVLVMKPDITLAVLTASGITEPRADWIATATTNLSREAEEFARARGLTPKAIDPDVVGGEGGHAAQVLKLHRAVGQSIATHSYGLIPLPTKKEFDWTLGGGAASLDNGEAAYALFMFGDGTYADGGRVAMTVAMAMLGVGMSMGSQQVFVSLVELKTGRVVWSNFVVAGSNDMRTPEGANALAASLFKDAPL